MKLVMTLLTRDEEDVIEANLVYHLERGVDFVIAMDNGSRDGTLEVLHAYKREGLLHLIEDPAREADYRAWRRPMGHMAHTEFGADWVFNNDADEFWWPDRGSLKEVLNEVPAPYGVIVAPRSNFLPSRREEGFFAERLVVREKASTRETFSGSTEPLPFKVAYRAGPEVVAGEQSPTRGAGPVAGGWHPITILHFPIRGYAQWARKIENTALAKREAGLPEKHYGERHRLLLEGRLAEHYEELAPADNTVIAGIEAGQLVIDQRLQGFFAACERPPRFPALACAPSPGRWTVTTSGEESSGRPVEPVEREARMLGSIVEHERRLRLERRSFERKLVGMERRLSRTKERRKLAEQRQKRAEAHLKAQRRSLWWRLGAIFASGPRGMKRVLGR